MAVIAMQKVAVIAHSSLKEEVLQNLQEMGVLEIAVATTPPVVDHTEVNFKASELKFAFETLKTFAPKEIEAALSIVPTPQDILTAAKHTDVRGITETLHRLEEEDTHVQKRLTEIITLKQILHPWQKLPYSLNASLETQTIRLIIGTVPEAKTEELRAALAAQVPFATLDVIEAHSGTAYCTIIARKEVVQKTEEVITTFGWTSVKLPTMDAKTSIVFQELLLEEKTIESVLHKNKQERRKLALELPNLAKMQIFLGWLNDKQSAREAMVQTFATVTLLGWIPRDSLAAVEKKLNRISSAIAVLRIKADEGEDVPVFLKNFKWLSPFENVTTLYGLPLYSEMDPTIPLSPFFALFFALCLTDGGYGLVLAVLFGAYIVVSKKGPQEAQLPWLLFFSGIIAILVGIPFGGWFGLTPEQVPEFLTTTDATGTRWFVGQLWNLSTEKGINFLRNLSLALGIIHIFFGVFLAGWHKWLHGDKKEAFWQHFTAHILLGAVLCMVLAPIEYALITRYALYVAIAMFVWGKGYGNPWFIRPIMGMLGVANFAIGLLSNGLSYLRILALGLVTGAIALAVNQVSIEMAKLFPIWLGIPVMILIAIGGHAVSIALNTLGSYIHSGRLQFIEFFGQFFEGGGRPYNPFKRSIF